MVIILKAVVTADLHLHNYTDKINSETNRSYKLEKIIEGMIYIADYAIKNNIENFIIAGDTMHGKDIIHNVALNALLDFIKKYENKLIFYFLDGNHDMSSKSAIVTSALTCLSNIENVIHISKPVMIEDCFFVPYSFDMEKYIEENSAKFLFSHFGLNEATLASGISIISKIKASDLIGKYKYVILGHYHNGQEIYNNEIKIYYTGTPVSLDWGDKNQEKRFLIVDTDKEIIESIPVESTEKYYEFEINEKNKDELIAMAEELTLNGYKVKLVQKEGNFSDSITNENIIIVDKTEKDITNRGITLNSSIQEQLIKYLEIKEIPEKDRKKYLEFGIKLVGGENEKI
jgi:DNA repair exonuclease SbcCD nuclease subunit